MALLQLYSKNPDFSWILSKNPEGDMQIKSLREGHSFGWYSKGRSDTYNIYFKDHDTQVSFGDVRDESDFSAEYIDTSRYISSQAYIKMLDDFLFSVVRKPSDKDVGNFESTIHLSMVDVVGLDKFAKYFPDFTFTLNPFSKNKKVKSLLVSTQKPIRDLICCVMAYLMMTSIKTNQLGWVDDNWVEKAFRCLNKIKAPIGVRQYFKVNLINSPKIFTKLKSQIDIPGVTDFKFGSTSMARHSFVSNNLSKDMAVYDFGCGEGAYFKYAKKLEQGLNWYYHDIDEERMKLCEKLVKKKELVNVVAGKPPLTSGVDNTPFVQAVMVEVLEHMPKEGSRNAIIDAVENLGIQKLILTLPNRNFNKYYLMSEDETRLDDHFWEPDYVEAVDFVKETLSEEDWVFDFFALGDLVLSQISEDGVVVEASSPTTGIVITRRK